MRRGRWLLVVSLPLLSLALGLGTIATREVLWPKGVTERNFHRIHPGLSREEVERILSPVTDQLSTKTVPPQGSGAVSHWYDGGRVDYLSSRLEENDLCSITVHYDNHLIVVDEPKWWGKPDPPPMRRIGQRWHDLRKRLDATRSPSPTAVWLSVCFAGLAGFVGGILVCWILGRSKKRNQP
jgi:hypothetical protein